MTGPDGAATVGPLPMARRRVPVVIVAAVVVGVASTTGVGCDGSENGAEMRGGEAFVSSRGPEPATVWAVGDGAKNTAGARAVVRRIGSEELDMLFYLGDVYEHGTAREFRTNYEPLYGRFAKVTAPTPGNHDWPNSVEGYEPYWERAHGRRPPAWYAFTIAGWEVLSLNSEAEHGPESEQVRWLRSRLAGSGTCRIAFWHRPRYSAGAHGDDRTVEPFWEALGGRARIVLNGHEHNMQRLRKLRGITELVAGAGGRSHYNLDEADARLAFADEDRNGALRLRLRPGEARFAFVDTAGEVLDSGRVRCRPAESAAES